MTVMTGFDIKDPTLAEQGHKRIKWALKEMPVLHELAMRFSTDRPLQGVCISGCLHITTETANLARTLKNAGADIVLCASNPLSIQDDVAAALVERYEIPMSIQIDELTEAQIKYLSSWQKGT